MKLLYISSRRPNSSGKGDALTAYHYLRLFAQFGWEVDLAYLDWPGDNLPLELPEEFGGRVLRAPVSRFDAFRGPALKTILAGLPAQAALTRRALSKIARTYSSADYDLVYFHYLRAACHVDLWETNPSPSIAGLQLAHSANYEKLSESSKNPLVALGWRIEARRCLGEERRMNTVHDATVYTLSLIHI